MEIEGGIKQRHNKKKNRNIENYIAVDIVCFAISYLYNLSDNIQLDKLGMIDGFKKFEVHFEIKNAK